MATSVRVHYNNEPDGCTNNVAVDAETGVTIASTRDSANSATTTASAPTLISFGEAGLLRISTHGKGMAPGTVDTKYGYSGETAESV